MEEPSIRPGKPGGKRDTNRKKRIAQIRASALELFAAQGIDPTAIDQITSAAGIAKGSFYRYFRDKTALVSALFRPLFVAVTEATEWCIERIGEAETVDDCVRAYEEMSRVLAPVILEQPLLLRIYLQERCAVDEGPRGVVRDLADLVAGQALLVAEAAHDKGLFRGDVPHMLSALVVVGGLERLAEQILDDPGALGMPPSEVGRSLVRLILDGLVPRSRARLF